MQASEVNTYKNDRMNMFKRLTAYITFQASQMKQNLHQMKNIIHNEINWQS